jgi:hypothetical protein
VSASRPGTPSESLDERRVDGALRITWTADRLALLDHHLVGLSVALSQVAVAPRHWWQ